MSLTQNDWIFSQEFLDNSPSRKDGSHLLLFLCFHFYYNPYLIFKVSLLRRKQFYGTKQYGLLKTWLKNWRVLSGKHFPCYVLFLFLINKIHTDPRIKRNRKVISTACVFFHRFYAFHSFQKFKRFVITSNLNLILS